MKNLLDQDAPGLYDRLQRASLDTCRQAVLEGLRVVASTLEPLPEIVASTLEKLATMRPVSPEKVAEVRVRAEEADENYLELQEKGEDALALARFSEARLLTAVLHCFDGVSVDDLAEATYELLQATDEPSVAVRAIEDRLRHGSTGSGRSAEGDL